jgi:hypothetical protein
MEFHLEFTPKSPAKRITLNNKLLLIGSCFTENIGEKLRNHKFDLLQNPNGILFNPVSITKSISSYISNKRYTEQDLFYQNECWHSWDHHSRYSGPDETAVVNGINKSISQAHEFLKHTDFLMITLGSAWVYELMPHAPLYSPDRVAANNHKAPANWFQKRLLTVEEIHEMLQTLRDSLKRFNPELELIFTISPVRHLREGFIENNRSKAALITAIHRLVDQLPGAYYFPAYELVIDDLRDYRFYAEDLVHPNYAATNYVWDKFVNACISDDTKVVMKEINEINSARSHKPFNPASKAHRKFLDVYREKLAGIMKRFPNLDFSADARFFETGK